MAANVNDKITKFSNGSQPLPTQLTAQRTAGATTASIAAATGWDTSTAKYVRMYQTTVSGGQTIPDQSTLSFFKATLSGTTLSNLTLIWSATGSDQTYPVSTTVDLAVAPGYTDDLATGLMLDHDQLTGYHKTLNDPSGNEWIKQSSTASAINEFTIANAAVGTGPTLSATGGDTNIDINLVPKGSGQLVVGGRYDGWSTGALPAVNSVTNNGNRSYDITFASTVASTLSSGMRLRTTRTVAAPTQCTSLNGSTQYYSKATPNKLTFTDDFVVSAWVKLSSYADGDVVSCLNGTQGWELRIDAAGQVNLIGYNASLANYSQVKSYQSVPLNKWVHIAAQLDMNTFTATTTTSYVMFDGKDVPASVSRAGTNPTALVQAGNLNIGAANGGTRPFPGKIAQVAIYNAKVTQATILASINQGLSGSETSLASAYSFNNAITDLNTTTPNDLTASGSAVATNADSPFGNAGTSSTLDYALVQAISTTVATVQVPEGCTIPTSGGITSVAYSVQGNPFGWVSDKGRWSIYTDVKTSIANSGNTANTTYNAGGVNLSVPVGAWDLLARLSYDFSPTSTAVQGAAGISTSTSLFSDSALSDFAFQNNLGAGSIHVHLTNVRTQVNLSVATPYYVLSVSGVAGTASNLRGNSSSVVPELSRIQATPVGL